MAAARAGGDAGGELRHLRPGVRAAASTVPREPGSEEYLRLREVPAARTGTATRPTASRRFIARVNRDPPRATRRCSATAACASCRSTTTSCIAYAKTTRRRQQRRSSSWSTSTRTTRRRAGSTSTSRRSASTPDAAFQVHDLLTDAALPLAGRAQLRAARPAPRAGAHLACVRRRVRERARLRLLPVSDLPHERPVARTRPRNRRDRHRAATRSGTRTRSSTSSTSRPSSTRNDDGIGDFRGLTEQARLRPATSASTRSGCCRSIRRRCATTATTSPTTTTSTRSTARCEDFRAFVRRGARARPARHHRAGHQPHLRPASVVPGARARAPPGSPERNFYVWSDTDQQVRRHAHHLHRHRDVELDLGPGRQGSTTGTASSATSPT